MSKKQGEAPEFLGLPEDFYETITAGTQEMAELLSNNNGELPSFVLQSAKVVAKVAKEKGNLFALKYEELVLTGPASVISLESLIFMYALKRGLKEGFENGYEQCMRDVFLEGKET